MKAFWASTVTVIFSAAIACTATVVNPPGGGSGGDGGGGGNGDGGGGGGGDGSSTTTSESLDSDQLNMACPSNSTRLIGTKSPGDACEQADDCKPTCCPCATGSNQWLAAACENKKCADTSTTCSATRANSTYCQ